MPQKIPTHRPKYAPTRAQVAKAYEANDQRAASKKFFNSGAWKKLRLLLLADQPLCSRCPPDRLTPATEVHHKKPRDVRPDLALVLDNLEGLCHACHGAVRVEDKNQRLQQRGR